MMEKIIDYKSLPMSVKDVDTKTGIVCGYYAAFDNIDSYGDMIIRGAFKKTIKERGPGGTDQIKHLLQHNTWDVIGKPIVLKEDNHGLYFEAQFSKIQKAQDVITQYAEGILNEHSIGYRTIKEELVEEGKQQYMRLTEIKLWEGSTVTWGANPNTPFVGFKSQNKEGRIEELKSRMDKVISILKVGSLSDETLEQAELELTKLHEAYISLTQEPEASTQQPNAREATLKAISEIITI